ncbi:hypothetical protein Focb16_v007465 [Fusarium oxysporum f. sp. cubense]|uniref:Uncharacterized protein n=1 Tax=Fusarium oxysporum f. sp. cubense TaxID=61366 RepID=A0A559LRZ0_FUSOC|nr:hypothetical protein Focb16_v007465 [Fusarium oxysporum f. sp. cubense]
MPPTSYIDYVVTQAQSNPRVRSLEIYIRRKATHSSKIAIIDYAQNGALGPNNKPAVLENCDIDDIIKQPAANTMRLLLIEDISPQIMIALGERFDINPIFFAEYVNPTITDVDKDPLSQSLATLPSFKPSEGYLHVPYQQILDLSSAKISYDMKNALHTASNVPRDVEHFAFLSGQQLISAHATCSVIIEKFKTYSICLILVDSPVTHVVKTTRAGRRRHYPASSLQAVFEESELRRSMTSYTQGHAYLDGKSMLDKLFDSFQRPGLFGDSAAALAISDFYRHSIPIVLTHWSFDVRLIDLLSRGYKLSLEDTKCQVDNDYLLNLNSWRQQIWQRRRRLTVLSESVNFRIAQQCDTMTWQLLLSDITELQDQLQDCTQLFEDMVVLTRLMIQNSDSRKSIFGDVNVVHLTYIAILFAPGFFVSSMFSMSMYKLSDRQEPWIYISTTLLFLVPAIVLLAQYQEVVQAVEDIYRESIRVYKSAYLRSLTQQEMV